jgi:predicted dehydrogenase
VFVEKPVADTLEDPLAIESACTAAGAVTQTGFNQRFWEPVKLAKQGLSAGVVSNLHGFRSVYSQSYTK